MLCSKHSHQQTLGLRSDECLGCELEKPREVFVVLRPENLLPVAVYREHQAAWQHATDIRGEVAPVEMK